MGKVSETYFELRAWEICQPLCLTGMSELNDPSLAVLLHHLGSSIYNNVNKHP